MDDAAEPYVETLVVPATWWMLGALTAVAMFWVFVLATPLLVALAAGLVTLLVAGVVLRSYGAARVATDPDGFSAGRALLPYRHIGVVEALNDEETRRVLGVEADARAYLLVRSYCHGAVKVAVADPADPTPYWLISTRHPTMLATRIDARTV